MPDTGWRELVEMNWNSLSDENNLFEITMKDDSAEYPENVYGDGNSSEKIVETINLMF